MNLSFIDWIWRTRGAITLDQPLTTQETFDRLKPLVDETTTKCDVDGNRMSYVKTNPGAQDKLSTFSTGTFTVAHEGGITRLLYDARSNALALVLLAPLFFAGFSQLAVVINRWEDQRSEAAKADAEATGESAEEEEEEEPKQHHWIDNMLGAPVPETLAEKKARIEAEGEQKREKIDSKRPLYLSAIFLALYLVGRFLEPYLLRKTLRKTLNPEPDLATGLPLESPGSHPAN